MEQSEVTQSNILQKEPKSGSPRKSFGEAGNGLSVFGLEWKRFFGVGDPYDDIVWERRTAKITKGDNTVVFEQKNVEVPNFWSQSATDIVASKYFRGRTDSPDKEYSARQMVDRVAKAIGYWGLKDGYFASAEDSDNFTRDLTFLLINQYAAFNSPVWFNVGVQERPQCSACFILSVEDNMQSILDWYRDEGWIFKYGSGSGINLSKLRSSEEPLSRGGRSSGPVSFMKGADGVANSIRSGGTTRRAAKMVILNVDHPDIKNFVYCKKVIEDMTKALERSGIKDSIEADIFDPYTLLPYQNANNSVRVNDEFMRAVEADGYWDLKAVTDGSTVKTLKAKEIMDWCADAAWHSADPGIQYDTTINEWNTCSNTGRINASNPCVTGDTLIATKNGLRKIKDLVGTHPLIATIEGFFRASRVWQTGVKPIYRLTTKYGYSVKVTDDHRCFVAEKGDIPAKNLVRGDTLVLNGSGFGSKSLPESLSMAIGYAVGDGCITSKVTRGNPQLTVVGGVNDKMVLEQIAHSINVYSSGIDSWGRAITPVQVFSALTGPRVATSRPDFVFLVSTYAVLDKGSEGKKFTDEIFELNKKSLAFVLKGIFTADGTVSGNNEKGFYVGLDSISLELLEQVQLLLLNFGIKAKLYKNRRKELKSKLPDARRIMRTYAVKQIHSLRITRSSRIIFEKEIGFVAGTLKAEKLSRINKMSDAYKDEMTDLFECLEFAGVEPVFDLTESHTHHFTANGLLIHNCSEYMHLDNSACNLASLNLLKFLGRGGKFNTDFFRKAVDTMIMAQEIIVGNSFYPTERITENAKNYRELGLGYANLGASLMVLGLPYDSDAGRIVAGQITSLMCGEAYRMSAVLASIKGSFAGYEFNKEPMLGIIEKHMSEAEELYVASEPLEFEDINLRDQAKLVWQEAAELSGKYGVRNSQVTVLAPTGTIAFLMDCDTTGIEPELALVKYKKLVGGGVLKLINNQVPLALRRLGYSNEQANDIANYILAKETIEGAPHIRQEHLPVFDCSFRPKNGSRFIHHMGHIKMMAAAQPFISGAISKTVNLPSDATVEDVKNVFMEGWRLGLKAIAVYRDGSKSIQPLNLSKDKESKEVGKDANLIEKINGYTRYKLPDERPSMTHKFSVGGFESYLTVGFYPGTQKPGETFITTAKEGSTVSGLFDTIATLISMCLQSGVPLKALVKKFKDMRFDPAGFTNNPQIPTAKSIVDYVFRYLGVKLLNKEEREEIFGVPVGHDEALNPQMVEQPSSSDKILAELISSDMPNSDLEKTAKTIQADLSRHSSSPASSRLSEAGEASSLRHSFSEASAPACGQCGTLMIRAGSCYTCPNCFSTTGVCN